MLNERLFQPTILRMSLSQTMRQTFSKKKDLPKVAPPLFHTKLVKIKHPSKNLLKYIYFITPLKYLNTVSSCVVRATKTTILQR